MSRRPLRELAVGVRAIGLWVELLGTAATGGNATPRSWVIMRGSIAMATLLVAGRIEAAIELVRGSTGWGVR